MFSGMHIFVHRLFRCCRAEKRRVVSGTIFTSTDSPACSHSTSLSGPHTVTCSALARHADQTCGRTQMRRAIPPRFVVWTLLALARKTRHRSSARCSRSLLLDPLVQRQADVGVEESCSFRRQSRRAVRRGIPTVAIRGYNGKPYRSSEVLKPDYDEFTLGDATGPEGCVLWDVLNA